MVIPGRISESDVERQGSAPPRPSVALGCLASSDASSPVAARHTFRCS
eukprot:COSAG02_NODE_26858_length_622_cov_1.078394_1_plen_47_part_10